MASEAPMTPAREAREAACELLPCPFCGEHAELDAHWAAQGAPTIYFAQCSTCGVRCPAWPSKGEAAQAWNRRGHADATAAHAARVEELEGALKAILADPHGCPWCDSGKLRKPGDPSKGHDEACGYALAAAALNDPTRPLAGEGE